MEAKTDAREKVYKYLVRVGVPSQKYVLGMWSALNTTLP